MKKNISKRGPLESIIKVEPEEFQDVPKLNFQSIDEVLRAKAGIFSDPAVCLERLTTDQLKSQSLFTNKRKSYSENVEALARKGNEGLHYKDPHTCCFCQKKYSCRKYLQIHLETVHCKTDKYFCDHCPKIFFSKNVMIQHMQIHKKKIFECKFCDYKTAIFSNLKRHKLVHAAKVDCPKCKKKVSSLKIHMQQHKPKKSCPICQKMFTAMGMSQHMTSHRKTHICKKCNDNFDNKEALRRHNVIDHFDGEIFKCHCGSVFECKYKFSAHQKSHEDKKTCSACQKQFTNEYFKKHWEKKHLQTHGQLENNKIRVLNRSGPFICDKCGSFHQNRHLFLDHNNLRHSSPSFHCDFCPRSFTRKHFLVNHMKAAHLELFRCTVCAYKNSSKRNLKTHMLVHGPKTECKICHKFVANIYTHLRTHVKVKCLICSKILPKKSVSMHMKIHDFRE